jgi:prevent-host-death family protein
MIRNQEKSMYRIVNMHEAKTHFSKLVDDVIHGHEIIIAKAGKPVARIEPFIKKPKRRFGVLKGKVKIGKDFDSPLPDEILAEFED